MSTSPAPGSLLADAGAKDAPQCHAIPSSAAGDPCVSGEPTIAVPARIAHLGYEAAARQWIDDRAAVTEPTPLYDALVAERRAS
ncbi:MAG: hypothetical protein HZY75_13155 [Nocardioidaceae bacterium]|nr:MAG: hypothetical protein HZY75_13155 [Nocardioidaceae bacterium]